MNRSSSQDPEDAGIALPVAWVGIDDTPILHANEFASQFDNSMFFVSIGAIAPPLLLGTTEERLEKARELPFIPVRTIARIALTPERVEQLISILQENLERFKESTESK